MAVFDTSRATWYSSFTSFVHADSQWKADERARMLTVLLINENSGNRFLSVGYVKELNVEVFSLRLVI